MAKKMMSPNTRIDWITDPLYDPENPSAAMFTPATNISCAIVTGYTLNPTKSTVDTSKSICDTGDVENPGSYNYEGNLTFFREGDLADTTSDYARAFEFFKHRGNEGYLVRRTGLGNKVDVAAGNVVSSFKFHNDNPKDVVGDGEAPIQWTTKFNPQGVMSLFKTVKA